MSGTKSSVFAVIFFEILMMFPFLMTGQETRLVKVEINFRHPEQVIEGFGASDAWSCQYAGLWPEDKKKKMADLLFSRELDHQGKPIGIGLNFWRFSIGAGSAEQGEASDIKNEWRRQISFLKLNGDYDQDVMPGQLWFMTAAKARGVKNFLGFVNSPHVNFTLNGKSYSNDGKCNLDFSKTTAFCQDLISTIQIIKKRTGITLDYISPVNEPQWKWNEANQEGSPYTNQEIAQLTRALSLSLKKAGLDTKIQIAEAGQLDYLTNHKDSLKSRQVHYFFDEKSPGYVADLSNVDRSISGHSYFTTSSEERSVRIRSTLASEVKKIKGLRFWMSEYCILGDSLMKGEGRDTGISPALFIAKLIHHDLSYTNATSWQWWLAISPNDYKDGLVYIDKNKNDGKVYESKMLWALGNYSRFIPAGSYRLPVKLDNADQVYISSFRNQGKIIIVVVNSRKEDALLEITGVNKKQIKIYTTSSTLNLAPSISNSNLIRVPAESITTLLTDEK
jgi:O-glycosyl hydrolase